MPSGGISGLSVVLATAGGVLVYAGFQGLNPLQALKDVTAGKTKALESNQVSFVNDPSSIGRRGGALVGGGGGGIAQTSAGGSGIGARIVAAAETHAGEKYSQSKRWQEGYSDCSSFVGKALRDVGITPPGGSVTGSYLTWSRLKTVPKSQIQAGDLLCGSGHIAIALSPTTAIGQQNGKQNVRRDSISSVMWGQTWVPRRYVGTTSTPSTPERVMA
jgi:cell wall-associated NlpC family hydrolase